jgi:LysR family transcriptional regulator, low CO2-responsive transcriptional regulator
MKITIDSQHLRVFVTLARTLNMGRAAEELSLTPSGVSHCLKALESDLGARLFDRSSRRVALSEAGSEFLNEAEEILSRMKAMRSKVRTLGDWRQGQLRIGANATACQYILGPTLREFRESFPDYGIKIEQCSSKQAVSFLGDERLDLAVFTEPAGYAGMEFIALAEDDLQFFVNPLHPWAAKRKALREEIPQRKLIVPERTGDTYALIEAYFRDEGIAIQPIIEIANEDAIKQFVRLDLGVGVLPRWVGADEVSQGSLVALPLGRRQLKRRWGILHAKAHKPSFAENLFTNICRNVLRELVAKTGE